MVTVPGAGERIDVLRVAGGTSTIRRGGTSADQGHAKHRHRAHENSSRGPQRTNHRPNSITLSRPRQGAAIPGPGCSNCPGGTVAVSGPLAAAGALTGAGSAARPPRGT
jgi:hypothetical protein